MSDSYGFDGNIPEGALYGVYDAVNGEWTGEFYADLESAQAVADELDPHGPVGVVSVTDESDWL